MKEWEAVEAAVKNEDWPVAIGLVQRFAEEWRSVTEMFRIFVPSEGDAWIDASNGALSALVEMVQRPDVEVAEVEVALAAVREFIVLESSS